MSVKAFRLDLTPEQAKTLAAELQSLVEIGLDHPSIVMPLAAGLEGHTVYLAEEYVAAESLDIALRHYAPAALDTALPFLSQLAGAVDFARARGVGHGALHPRDIFLAPEIARATGFGIVQALERLGLRAPVRRPYSAPERVSGATWSTPADVFALGAVAHELLTGKRPAGTGEVAPIAGRAAESHPARLRAVLGRALAEDPAERFTTANALVAALEAAARGDGLEPLDSLDKLEDKTFALGRDDEERFIREPEPAAGPAPVVAEPQKEGPRRTPGSRRRKKHDEESTIAVKEELHELQTREEPSLFDLAKQPPPAGIDAEPGEEAPADVAQVSDVCVEEGEPVDDMLAPSERGYVPVEPIAAFPHAPYPPPAAERSRAAILPFAIVAMVSLLAGFLAGYALGSREQKPAVAESVASAPAAPTTGPAANMPGVSSPGPSLAPQKEWSEAAVEPSAAPGGPGAPATRPVAPRTEPSSPSAPRATAPKPAPISPAATTGTLMADSRPSGARVIVDGRAVGKTPLKLGGLKVGPHTVRFELEGYRAWTAEVTVTGGRETRVAGSLERVRTR